MGPRTDLHVWDPSLAFDEAAGLSLQLNPRQLPSRFLYDGLGSALFDAICHLPWYRVTRAELQLLTRYAATIGDVLERGGRIVELGGGNGEKLAALLTHAHADAVHVHLIDVSDAALARSVEALSGVRSAIRRVTTHHATYEHGLQALQQNADGPTLVAFLGSNIGNFDLPQARTFLGRIRAAIRPGDYLLLGVDLVKPEHELLLAYDDPLGVTAAFNKNLLVRMNAELQANFTIDQFDHRAVWNGDASRVEMHLVSRCEQEVEVRRAGLRFRLEEGETIWTESSYKFTPEGIDDLVEPSGFVRLHQWIDHDARFTLTLWQAV
jgi:dimethylhistidine N-methyltransferase